MKFKQSLIAAGALAVIGAGLVFANPVQAETSSTSLVDKLVARFNLDKGEVQTLFNEEKAARQAERQAKMEERLQTAVDEGKITTEQKDQIVAKLEELRASKPSREEVQSMSAEERKALRGQTRENIEQWAEDNNIPLEYLRPLGKGGPGHGMKIHFGS